MNMNVIDFYMLLSVVTLNRHHWCAEPERNFVAQQQGAMLCEMNPQLGLRNQWVNNWEEQSAGHGSPMVSVQQE